MSGPGCMRTRSDRVASSYQHTEMPMETMNAMPQQESDAALSQALARATLYSALAVGFHVPDKEGRERILSREGIDVLGLAAGVIDGTAALRSRVSRLLEVQESSLSSLIADHQRIFGHTVRGPVCPYETEYGAEALFQQPQQLGDLGGFYKAFGLALNTAWHERLDHISCECEFMAFLALKEAYAVEHHDAAMLEETGKASRLFLRDHLARFGLTFAKKLARENPGSLYGALGDLCFVFLMCECHRLDVEPGPVNLSLRPATDNAVPMACGGGTECTRMPGVSIGDEME